MHPTCSLRIWRVNRRLREAVTTSSTLGVAVYNGTISSWRCNHPLADNRLLLNSAAFPLSTHPGQSHKELHGPSWITNASFQKVPPVWGIWISSCQPSAPSFTAEGDSPHAARLAHAGTCQADSSIRSASSLSVGVSLRCAQTLAVLQHHIQL